MSDAISKLPRYGIKVHHNRLNGSFDAKIAQREDGNYVRYDDVVQALQSGEPSEWVIEVENGQVVMSRIGANFTGYLYTTPQPVVPEWIEGAPELGMYAILHVPCKGYPNFCVIGHVEDDGSVYDMCGDELGVCEDDIERWAKLPSLLSAGKGGGE